MLLLKRQVSNSGKTRFRESSERFYTQIAFHLSVNCSLHWLINRISISVVNARETKSYNHTQRKDLGL